MNDNTVPKQSSSKVPDYYNPHNIIQEPLNNNTPLLDLEPPEEDPAATLKKKYPIRTIAGIVVLVIMVMAIPIGVYLNQKPTEVFIEATSSPSPSPTPTPVDEA